MIARYTRPEMARIWSEENKFAAWLKIELKVCEAVSRRGKISKTDVAEMTRRARFDAGRIGEIEKTTKHDVVAFVTNVNESLGPLSKHFHKGLTSSDLLDTTLAIQLRDSAGLILAAIRALKKELRARAMEHRRTVGIARTHGVHAEPTCFGLKFVLWFDELARNEARLRRARSSIAVGKISGAVGTYAHLGPDVEKDVCRSLGLKAANISTQIVQRDHHAEFFSTLALLASSLEKIAVEIRHLQRSEVLEVEEPFAEGQAGSSAMPHKKNPVLSENIAGLARLVRSYAIAALENVALWHERDISHSSVERIIGPDATIAVHFMLWRMVEIMSGLVVHRDRIRANVDRLGGLVYSQRVLVALMEGGMGRDEAYKLVQRHALAAWKNSRPFKTLIESDPRVRRNLGIGRMRSLFKPDYFLRHVDQIYRRVFSSSRA